MTKVLAVEPIGAHNLRLQFSDGRLVELDLAELLSKDGPMLEPLRDPGYFARVFLEHGCPTWPNGLDLDAEALHRELCRAPTTTAPVT